MSGAAATSSPPSHGNMPVSYTHLDVYKRQALRKSGVSFGLRFWIFSTPATHFAAAFESTSEIPVSYTHLDVYKRQVVLLSKKVIGRDETQAAEWGADVRLGYQYKRFRLEAFYQQSLSSYHQIAFSDPIEMKHLFMAKTAGITLGFRLFGKGK